MFDYNKIIWKYLSFCRKCLLKTLFKRSFSFYRKWCTWMKNVLKNCLKNHSQHFNSDSRPSFLVFIASTHKKTMMIIFPFLHHTFFICSYSCLIWAERYIFLNNSSDSNSSENDSTIHSDNKKLGLFELKYFLEPLN